MNLQSRDFAVLLILDIHKEVQKMGDVIQFSALYLVMGILQLAVLYG
jgi:recombinational DNA repair protein RecR